MGFKEMLENDVSAVLLNPDEFAEIHTVRYDGEVYEDIPVVITKLKQSDRVVLKDDHMEGVFLVSGVAYIAEKDMQGVVPEQGQKIEINDGEALGKPFYVSYTVVTSKCEHGMITLELRCYDE